MKATSQKMAKLHKRKINKDPACFLPETYSTGAQVQEYLHDVLSLLKENKWVYNFQLTKFFVDKVWEEVPKEWTSHLLSLSIAELNSLPFENSKECWPESLKSFVSRCMNLSLDRTVDQTIKPVELSKSSCIGMKPKKIHEVSHMAGVVQQLCAQTRCDLVVDIGAGLGYLGHTLNAKYGLRVLGVESKAALTKGADNRTIKHDLQMSGVEFIEFELENTEASLTKFRMLLEDRTNVKRVDHTFSQQSKPSVIQSSTEVHQNGPVKQHGDTQQEGVSANEKETHASNNTNCHEHSYKNADKIIMPEQLSSEENALPVTGSVACSRDISRNLSGACSCCVSINLQRITGQNTDSKHVCSQTMDSSTVCSQAMDSSTVCSQAMDSSTVCSQAMDSSTVCSQAMDRTNSTVCSQTMDSSTVCSQTMDSSTVCSQATDSSTVCCERKDLGGVCMIGLHCCGDLTPTMLKMFSALDQVQAMACVSCCYHKMSLNAHRGGLPKEKLLYVEICFPEGGTFNNFPLSQQLTEAISQMSTEDQSSLNVFALRLAAQETRARWKDQTEADHHFHMKNVAYRGIIELLQHTDEALWHKVKRKVANKKDFESFDSYTSAVLERVSIQGGECSEAKLVKTLRHLHDFHLPFFQYIEPITGLQVLLQPVLESLVIVDRLLYLSEQGLHCRAVPIFNELLSPRNMVIVVTK